jgi:hypothetical protein
MGAQLLPDVPALDLHLKGTAHPEKVIVYYTTFGAAFQQQQNVKRFTL